MVSLLNIMTCDHVPWLKTQIQVVLALLPISVPKASEADYPGSGRAKQEVMLTNLP